MSRPSLTTIVASTRARVAALRPRAGALAAEAERSAPPPRWTAALGGDDVAVIAEVKRRSPSAGAIAPDLDPVAHARGYVAGGAAAVSVLTDEAHFGGSLNDLVAVRRAVDAPLLRKDFIIDPVQLHESRVAGASAVLLIVRVLSPAELRDLGALAAELGLARLVEVHEPSELDRAIALEPEAIGINSRDLATFRVDLDRAGPLLGEVPGNVIAVAESGITSRTDVERLAAWGADAILVGTVLARDTDPVAGVRRFTGVRRGDRRRDIRPVAGAGT